MAAKTKKRAKKRKKRKWSNPFPPKEDKTFWKRWHRSKVLKVYDGDTFWITKKDAKKRYIRVRISDVHMPELKYIGGCTAKSLLSLILPKGQTVYYYPRIPHFHRLVCKVRVKGTNLNRVLSRVGITAKRNDKHICPGKPEPRATW